MGDNTDPRGQRRFARQVDGAVTVEAVDLRDLTDIGSALDLAHPDALSIVANFAENLMSPFSADNLLNSDQGCALQQCRPDDRDVGWLMIAV
jgi:DNA helicase-2/ATP-dependent DNA helicase PcrA